MTEEPTGTGRESSTATEGETGTATERGTPTTEKGEPYNLEWKCLTCGKAVPATERDYMGLIRHKCTGKAEIWLVDKDNGEKVTNQLNTAKQMGILTEAKGKPKAKVGADERGIEVSSEGIFTYTLNLPADAVTLFNLAKFAGLEPDGDKPFDVWVWECITARFRYDYKMQLILAPILEEKT